MRLVQPLNSMPAPTVLQNQARPLKIVGAKQPRFRPELPLQPVLRLRSGGTRALPSSSTHARKLCKKSEGLDPQKFPNLRHVLETLRDSDRFFLSESAVKLSSNAFVVRAMCVRRAIELKASFALLHETVFLSVHLMDVYLRTFPKLLESLEAPELDYLRDLEELPPDFPESDAARDAERVLLSAVFMASKFQEIHPPKLSEIAGPDLLSMPEFCLIEAAILKAVDFNIRPSPFASYVQILNSRAFGSALMATKILRVVYVGLMGGYLSQETPFLAVMALGQLFAKRNGESSERAFRNFRIELGVCSKQINNTGANLALGFNRIVGFYERRKVEKIVSEVTEGDQIFSNELQKKF